jgi:hypothetical protein
MNDGFTVQPDHLAVVSRQLHATADELDGTRRGRPSGHVDAGSSTSLVGSAVDNISTALSAIIDEWRTTAQNVDDSRERYSTTERIITDNFSSPFSEPFPGERSGPR